jgi:hypothetical protein
LWSQIDEIDIAIEAAILVAEPHHRTAQLLALGYVGHEANGAECLLLRLGERG